eukprot:3888112-Rhodomonas_salina.1
MVDPPVEIVWHAKDNKENEKIPTSRETWKQQSKLVTDIADCLFTTRKGHRMHTWAANHDPIKKSHPVMLNRTRPNTSAVLIEFRLAGRASFATRDL